MIKTSSRAMLTLLTVIVLFSSCKRDFEKNQEEPPTKQTPYDNDYRWNYQGGSMVLGKQLQNPYTIPNITAAYTQAVANGASSLFPVNIRITHYYVKYKPANEYQYAALEGDSTLDLYDYPLDYEITQDGNYYHDP